MPKLSRRETLARGGQAVAAAAVLSVVPFPVERTDTALFDLRRQWQLAVKIRQERRAAWVDAVEEHLPPEYRQRHSREIPVRILEASFQAPSVKALDALCDQAEAELREIKRRIFATPAHTIGGIATKLQIRNPNLSSDLERSVLADAERLAGRAS